MEITVLLPFICLVLEVLGFTLVVLFFGGACIQAGEITIHAYIFLIFIYAVTTSDLFYGTYNFYKNETAIRDFSFIYHLLTFIISLAGGLILGAGLTFCGNIAQICFLIAGLLAILAGIIHLVNAILVRKKL